MAGALSGIFQLVRFVARHPVSEGRRLDAFSRVLRWQLGSRLLGTPAVIDWVGGSRLIVQRGMTGATGNLYVGLHEFADMAFVLHFVRHSEVFLDVGANIGSYTILAASVCGARVISFEPVPSTYQRLLDNIRINGCGDRVQALMLAVGDSEGQIQFTADLDSMNRALEPGEVNGDSILVPVRTLDGIFLDGHARGDRASLVKIDVEGYETKVVQGGQRTLADASAVIVELRGPVSDGTAKDRLVYQQLQDLGFAPVIYDPLTRRLSTEPGRDGGNALFVRDLEDAKVRVRDAPLVSVLGKQI